MHTSYSALNTYKTCPLKYKYQVIDRLKTPPSPQQIFGSLIHSTMKFIHSPGPKGFPDAESAVDYFGKNWKNDIFSGEECQNYFQEGVGIIQKYMESLKENERQQSIALEYRFTIPIDKHTLGGSIDRVDRTSDGFEIIDYKTDRKVPPQDRLDQDLQLSIYLKAFIKEWPSLFERVENTDKIHLTLFYLRHGLRLFTTRNLADLKQIEINILEVINEVEKATEQNQLAPGSNQGFEPRLNALCDWCSFQKICPMWKHKYKSLVLSPESGEKEMQEMGKRFIQLKVEKRGLEKEIGEIGKELATYMEREKLGQFFSEKGSILRALRQSYKYDSKAMSEILNKFGKDPFSVMKIDSAALRKVLAGLPAEQRRELLELKKVDKQMYVLVVKGHKT